jgi:hypothetical protein
MEIQDGAAVALLFTLPGAIPLCLLLVRLKFTVSKNVANKTADLSVSVCFGTQQVLT